MNRARAWRPVLSLAVGASMLGACESGTKTPGGGGDKHDYRDCSVGVNNAWANSNSHVEVPSPKQQCPITVTNANSYIIFVFDISSGGNSTQFPWASILILDVFHQDTILSVASAYLGYDSFHLIWVANVTTSAQPGLSVDPDSAHRFFDSTVVKIMNTASGTATAFGKMPGIITSAAGTILGPSSIDAGVGGNWRVRTDWDTTGYVFAWNVNGSYAAATNGLTTSFATHGWHTVQSIATRSDDVADTLQQSVNVAIGAIIGGVPTIPNGYEGVWTANVSGAHAPVTCIWYVDSYVAQSGSCTFTHTFSDGPTTHNLDVRAVDDDSAEGWGFTFPVEVCTNCDVERRLPVRIRAGAKPVVNGSRISWARKPPGKPHP